MGELMTIKNIGFIGLGAMGSVMAPLIVKSGCNVLGYDIKAKIDKLSGVKQVEDINEFNGLDVIIFMLPNGRVVSEMAIKLLEKNLKSVFIDMSSSDPRETQELGNKLKYKNVKFLDAPVSGGVARAKTGDLMIMAGGDKKLLEEVNDLFILAFISYPRTLHPDFTISGAITEPIAPRPINPIFLIVISSPIFELYLYSTFRNKAFNLKF